VTAGDGSLIPGWQSWYKTEYDIDGRFIATRSRNSDGSEWETRYAYNEAGQLIQTAWGNVGKPTAETVYSYNGGGRLMSIADSRTPDNPVRFVYDERGKRTKVQVSRPGDYRPNVAVAGSPFQVADSAPNLAGGGSATTLYDDQDRPYEIQIRDAQGELMSRAVRSYDDKGNVIEEKQILENPETIIPAEMRAQILESSGSSLEELRAHLTNLMGGQAGPFSIVYSYNARGLVEQTTRRIFNREDRIETTYNGHGDNVTEITRTVEIKLRTEQSMSQPGLPSYSEGRCSYQYDNHGNWIEKIVSYRSSPGGAFESSGAFLRTLTYF
jgi:YD repeat-containing protein